MVPAEKFNKQRVNKLFFFNVTKQKQTKDRNKTGDYYSCIPKDYPYFILNSRKVCALIH